MASSSGSSSGPPKGPLAKIQFNPGYVASIPGIIKVAEAALSLIVFICIQTIYMATYFSAGGWVSFVSMSGFWVSLILLLFYIFHFVEKFTLLPWLLVEFVYAAIWSVFYFIAACVAASNGRADPGWGASSFFGFAAMGVFSYEAFRKYQAWKRGDVAQGGSETGDADISPSGGPSYPTY